MTPRTPAAKPCSKEDFIRTRGATSWFRYVSFNFVTRAPYPARTCPSHRSDQRGTFSPVSCVDDDSQPLDGNCLQALGLLALQYGQNKDAVQHLESAAAMDPSCAGVLKWKQFEAAKQQCTSGAELAAAHR
jgi:hypothetical protein